MLINRKNISLTLFTSLILTLSLTVFPVVAHDFAQPVRRDHDSLRRLVRKRAPLDSSSLPLQNNVPDPNAASASGSASAAASSPLSSASALSEPSSAALSVSASLSASNSASNSASAASNSVSASVVSSTSAPGSPTSTPPVPPTTPSANDNGVSAAAHQTSTVTHTTLGSVLNAAATNPPAPNGATAQNTSTITTVLIVVAASVAGVAILWTIFRKWKLGHSAKFEERMAPIDWQPTNDEGIVPAHRLGRSTSRASSITSSSQHDHAAGYALGHDFTAPPSHLAAVGGYADLARGPSPQPPMQESLNRGPSLNRSYGAAYNTGVPLHHQTGYGGAEAYDYNGDAVRF